MNNAATAAQTVLLPAGNVKAGPGYTAAIEPPSDQAALSFWERRALDLKIKTMPGDTPTKPYWNTTMITAWVAVIVAIFTISGAIFGGIYFAYSLGEKAGDERATQRERMNQQQAEIDKLNKALEDSKAAAQAAKDLELLNQGK